MRILDESADKVNQFKFFIIKDDTDLIKKL